jgi:hypothetical protein
MPTTLRSDLLPSICAYLPEPDAHWIESRDPSDYLTHLEAYACLRRNAVALPKKLMRDFANGLVNYLEGPADSLVAR